MLKLENITKYYYSSTSVTCALRKVNLEFKIGEFVAITGESGSGKTTLLNLISGLDSYEDGEMYFNGKKTSFFDDSDWETYRKEEISFIFQNYNLIDSYTVTENVISALIIDGYTYPEAKKKAKELLKFVGLEKDGHKKASKLSGGQKQRLSIARALAKNTNIIVADEPTGNLDVENGKAILELLKKVSENKLVIVVTHNLGQVEPYATRKIRLHDGEVTLDEVLVQTATYNPQKTKQKKTKKIRQIFDFAFLNIKSQPNKTILMLFLMFIAALSSFTFVVNFKANLDEDTTRYLEDDFFLNYDDTRLLVKRNDGDFVDEKDFNNAMVEKVVSYEKYDYITDVNYFREEDYELHVNGGYSDMTAAGPGPYIEVSYLEMLNYDKFMRSASSLSTSMLKYGRLPKENSFEMVIYDNDDSKLGTVETVLFLNDRRWSKGSQYSYNVEIVGILNDFTEQAYFSEQLCKLMDISQHSYYLGIEYYDKSTYMYPYKRKIQQTVSRMIFDDRLKGNEVALTTINLAGYLKNVPITGEENGFITINGIKEKKEFTVRTDIVVTVSESVIAVSREFFDSVYEGFGKRRQFAVFISDYAYTDDVLKELSKIEMEGLSCFRSSLSDFNPSKVAIRYVNLVVSVIALLIMNGLVVLIGFTMLKVKKNDYVIFKMIGLTNDLCVKINRIELLIYTLIANVLSFGATLLVSNFIKQKIVIDFLKFSRFYDYLIVLAISIIAALYTSICFSKFINTKIKASVLKEE